MGKTLNYAAIAALLAGAAIVLGGCDGGALGTSAGGRGGPSSRKIEPNCACTGAAPKNSAAIASRQIDKRDRAIGRFSAGERRG